MAPLLCLTINPTLDFGGELLNLELHYSQKSHLFGILNSKGFTNGAVVYCRSSSLAVRSQNVKLVCIKWFPGKWTFMYVTLPTFWAFCNFVIWTNFTFLLPSAKLLNLHWSAAPFLNHFELVIPITYGFWSYVIPKLSNLSPKSNVGFILKQRKYSLSRD